MRMKPKVISIHLAERSSGNMVNSSNGTLIVPFLFA